MFLFLFHRFRTVPCSSGILLYFLNNPNGDPTFQIYISIHPYHRNVSYFHHGRHDTHTQKKKKKYLWHVFSVCNSKFKKISAVIRLVTKHAYNPITIDMQNIFETTASIVHFCTKHSARKPINTTFSYMLHFFWCIRRILARLRSHLSVERKAYPSHTYTYIMYTLISMYRTLYFKSTSRNIPSSMNGCCHRAKWTRVSHSLHINPALKNDTLERRWNYERGSRRRSRRCAWKVLFIWYFVRERCLCVRRNEFFQGHYAFLLVFSISFL